MYIQILYTYVRKSVQQQQQQTAEKSGVVL
jgi:hypothetical protein